MINPNYRYAHLARLIQIVNGPLPGMQAIRRLDQTFGTTYFNEIFHARQWPAYVQWFGIEDHLSDIATDYAAEIYDADDFGDWLSKQKKIQSHTSLSFTPTTNQDLRTELHLDQYENSWLFGVNRTNFRRELSKNNLDYKPHYAFMGFQSRMNLTYALFARRRSEADKLYAFCLAQAIFDELQLKLFSLPRMANFHPLPSEELLNIGEPIETILDVLNPSLAWSYDAESFNWLIPEAASTLQQSLNFASNVMARNWPQRDVTDTILKCIFHDKNYSFISLTSPQLFNSVVEL